MTLTLTPELEKALGEAAQRQGTTPELLAIDYLRKRFVPASVDETATRQYGSMADYWADHIGVLDSGELVPGGAQLSGGIGKRIDR